MAHSAWEEGDFAPTAGPVLMSAKLANAGNRPSVSRILAMVWSDKYMIAADGTPTLTAGRDYETFNAVVICCGFGGPDCVALGSRGRLGTFYHYAWPLGLVACGARAGG